MKSNLKKTLCLLLSLVMLLSALACTVTPETPAAVTEEPAAAETEMPAAAPEAEEVVPETEAAPQEKPEGDAAEEAGEEAEEDALNITILYEQDDAMINNYSLLAVNEAAPFADMKGNPVSDVALNTVGAKALIDWLLSEDGAELIANFGVAEYGMDLFYLAEDRPESAAQIPAATEETKQIRLSTTTSVYDSGLLKFLLPFFEDAYGYKVEVTPAGTGKAIENAKMGNADLILVHSKSQEEAFIAEGFSKVLDGYESERLTFMYNYFVLIGPKDDPAGCAAAPDVRAAFRAIADGEFTFISRGDSSGTHTKEISLWPEELGITTDAESIVDYSDWYTFSNAGMGVCLMMANETDSYILSDKATFLTFRENRGEIG